MQQTGMRTPYLRHAGAIALLLCAALAFAPWLDQRADSSLSTAIISTLTLYASVRGVDSVVSALAGTELQLTPVGIGVTFAPGELLDPINDLVEQLGDVLLWVLTLMGIERLSIALLGSIWIRVLSGLLLGGAALVLWLRPQWGWPRPARKFVVALVLLRLVLPLVAISSELIAQHVVDSRTDGAESALVTMSQQLSAEQSQANASNGAAAGANLQEPPSLLQRLGNATRSINESLQIEARMKRISQQLETGVNHAVDLLALVVLRALLFPALFLFSAWLTLRIVDD